jgi:dihydroorotate dehydrogenase
VSFGVTQVREYELVIGDHPECKIGVPLSLGWGYHEQESIPMEKYENERVSKGKLRMSSIARKNILRNVFGFPEEEIRAAEKEVQRIVKQKENTYSEANVSTKTQSRLKKVGKKFRKFITAESFIRGLAAASQSTMTMAAVTAP